MRTLVVGDVHGCADELRALLKKASADRVVLVGDLFTKGPKPVGVWKTIRRHGLLAVLGNHDQRLLDALDGKRPADHPAMQCIARLNRKDPAWVDWLRALPLYEKAGPFTVVHAGMHPSGKKRRTSRRDALVRRRWPVDDAAHPLWHQVYWGKRRIIFGHDAVRGHIRVERDGEPWLIGLDTGCVYGGELSGYLVEEDVRISIPAKSVYCKPGRKRASKAQA